MKKKENKEQGQNVPEKDKQNKKEDKWKAELNSEKLKKRERIIRIIKISLLIIALFLIIIYFLLRLFYDGGAFTVALDDALAKKSGLIMYEKLNEKDEKNIKSRSIRVCRQYINKLASCRHRFTGRRNT